MSKRKKKRRFDSRTTHKIERKAKIREERRVKEELPLMFFSFKDFQFNQQTPPGQTYGEWQKQELLAYMLDKFGYICNVNRIEAEQQKFIKVYGEFPPSSKFQNPFPESDLVWAVINKIKGQKGRVAGYIERNVFYVVFLDANHLFYPSLKKNT